MESIIRLAEVTRRTGFKKSAVYQRLDPRHPRYDPSFPRSFKIGGSRATGFLASEIDAWVRAQAQQRPA